MGQSVQFVLEEEQIKFLKQVKEERDSESVEESLRALRKAADGNDNLLPYIEKSVEEYATVGEISKTLKDSFGKFRPSVTV